MEQYITSEFKLGVITGGQLGKMLILAASNWDVKTVVLDPSEDCPSANICDEFVQGSALDYDDVLAFGQQVDMIALELENVNLAALEQLKLQGKPIFPDPSVLKIIQDKGLQKQFYEQHQLPTSPFLLFKNEAEIRDAVLQKRIQLPFVQKTRTAGYDGKGVKLVKNETDLDKLLEGPSVIEHKIEIAKELAVIVAQNTRNEIRCFPLVEMVFNDNANLVEQLVCPARVSSPIEEKANQLAIDLAQKLDAKGLLAVELFLTKEGELLINEAAPRPHNSGHHTIEGTITSQYEQYLRAMFGFPLGDTSIKIPAVMINLLGEPNCTGAAKYEGIAESMKIDGVNIHIYGKKETKPFRKMGHVTIVDHTIEKAVEKANQVKKHLKVIA